MAVFERSFVVGASLESVWEFHSDPVALTEITPPLIHVHAETTDHPVRKGSIVRLLLTVASLRIPWNSIIVECEPYHYFSDEQIAGEGPFKRWKHTHRFVALERGTQITDYVDYEMPYGVAGKIADRLFGRLLIKSMFDARARATRSILERRVNGRVPDEC